MRLTFRLSPGFGRTRETAMAEHLPARAVAKSVVVFGDGDYSLYLDSSLAAEDTISFNAGTHKVKRRCPTAAGNSLVIPRP